jgi:hypothetical protein
METARRGATWRGGFLDRDRVETLVLLDESVDLVTVPVAARVRGTVCRIVFG